MTEARARIVLGATCYAEAHSALRIGLRVAARFSGELNAVLIEEEAVLAIARRPGARIITPAGQRVSGIGAESMAAAFLRDAERFERELAAAASSLPARWSFARRTGRMAALLTEAALAGDVLVLGGAPLARTSGDVVYLAGSHADPELEAIAQDLAADLHRPLKVILADETAAAPETVVPREVIRPRDAEALRRELARLPSDTILIANLANVPPDMPEVSGPARFTRILRSNAPREDAAGD